MLVLMSQEAFSKYGSAAADGAALIVDSDLVESADAARSGCAASRPRGSPQELGNRIVANIVMLGFFSAVTGVVAARGAGRGDPHDRPGRDAAGPEPEGASTRGFEYAPVGANVMSDSVLVIGGGIAGVQAALDLAEAGAKVVLVETGPSIGGKMAALDKNFPTLDCSVCIEAPKLSEVGEHPNIEILNNAEVVKVEGEAGDFRVTIRQRAGFVTSECTRCGECEPVCPVVLPNEFDAAMASRKAVYTPFPQADSRRLRHRHRPLPERAAQLLALPPLRRGLPAPSASTSRCRSRRNLSRKVARHHRLHRASRPSTRRPWPSTATARHPDVLTAMEFERLLTSAGPTGGEIVRPSDGKHPKSILFVLCVGSRDRGSTATAPASAACTPSSTPSRPWTTA